jgi:catechol 2,3-dioxygenase-like lactoylglutathione lyase family enzyme
MDWKIELVPIPVTDIDRSIAFYRDQVGFTLDHDHKLPDVRFTQLTPPGSACSILLDQGITEMTPGSQHGLQVVISDADVAHEQLTRAGVNPGAIQPLPWGRFITFADPDGNTWSLQESPNRVTPVTEG